MVRLRLRVGQREGKRVLMRGAMFIRFDGERSELDALALGAEVDAECAHVAGVGLIALSLGSTSIVDELGHALREGDTDTVLVRIDALEETSAIAETPELLALRVRALEMRAQPAEREALRHAFIALLEALRTRWEKGFLVVEVHNALGTASRDLVGVVLFEWLEEFGGRLPQDIDISHIPLQSISTATLTARVERLKEARGRSSKPASLDARIDACVQELSTRPRPKK